MGVLQMPAPGPLTWKGHHLPGTLGQAQRGFRLSRLAYVGDASGIYRIETEGV